MHLLTLNEEQTGMVLAGLILLHMECEKAQLLGIATQEQVNQLPEIKAMMAEIRQQAIQANGT